MARESNLALGNDYLRDPLRLAALHRLNVIDSGTEAVFDAITRLTAELFNVESAAIHLLDGERQWVKSASNGSPAPDTPISETFCQYAISKRDLVFVPDLSKDPRFDQSQFVTGPSKLRFYAGLPMITGDGFAVGTLCLLDTRENLFESFNTRELGLYRQLTDIVMRSIELRQSHLTAQHQFLQAVEEDGLTGLLNSRGVLADLQEKLAPNDGSERAAGLIEIRLKGLERIRRGYGTDLRNRILQTVVERLQGMVQPPEFLARISDASFLMITVIEGSRRASAQKAIAEWAEQRAQALLDLFDAPFWGDDESFFLTAHLGKAFSTRDEFSGYAALERADGAAFKAEKDSPGTSATCWSDAALDEEYRRGVSIEGRLRKAIDQKQLAVVYQPIVDLNNGNRIVGAEALVRWPQSSGPPIGPDFFVPLAEEMGLIEPMGLWVFEQACQSLRHWCESCDRNIWMSVNISPKQLQNPELASQLEVITRRAGLTPSQIKLEITESGLIERFDEVTQLLHKMVEIGFKLALDDFGTGHSSLSRLIHLPFNVLKVDRAFVSDSPDGPGAAVVASLSGLAQSLQLETVGEGIETEAQERFLRQHGYSYGQGYFYAKPLSSPDILAQLQPAH